MGNGKTKSPFNIFFNIPSPEKKNICLISLLPSQVIAELLQRTSQQLGLLPQVGSQESVGVTNCSEGSLKGVLEGLGRTGGGSIDVLDTSKLEKTLDGGGSDQAGTAGSRDQLKCFSIIVYHS